MAGEYMPVDENLNENVDGREQSNSVVQRDEPEDNGRSRNDVIRRFLDQAEESFERAQNGETTTWR